jgi:hypothetical protein
MCFDVRWIFCGSPSEDASNAISASIAERKPSWFVSSIGWLTTFYNLLHAPHGPKDLMFLRGRMVGRSGEVAPIGTGPFGFLFQWLRYDSCPTRHPLIVRGICEGLFSWFDGPVVVDVSTSYDGSTSHVWMVNTCFPESFNLVLDVSPGDSMSNCMVASSSASAADLADELIGGHDATVRREDR